MIYKYSYRNTKMDSNLVARVNVDAYCPKIRKKRQNVHSHIGCPKPVFGSWKLLPTPYMDNPSARFPLLSIGVG